MKVLVVRQPWAELIASGIKSIEVRSWRTNYRGPLLILAAAQKSSDPQALIYQGPWVRGIAVALVDLISVDSFTATMRTRACYRPSVAAFGWELTNPRRVPPVRTKGRLGLYDADEELLRLLNL